MSIHEIINKAVAQKENPSEIYFSRNRELEISAYNGSVNNFTSAEVSGAGARVITGKKIGAAYTEAISEESLRDILAQAAQNAVFSAEDAGNVLYEGYEINDDSDEARQKLISIPAEKKKQIALDIEARAKSYDSRIVNVPYAYYQEVTGEKRIVNSLGTKASRSYAFCGGLVYLVASDGKDTQVASAVRMAGDFDDIDIDVIVSEAADKALSMIGAGSVESGKYSIVLDESAASELLGAFIASGASHFYAENIQKGRSRFSGLSGEVIGCNNFTLIDDPRAGTIRSKLFDEEGVPTARQVLVNEGRLESVAYSVYAAARSGGTPTGHSQRGGFSGGVSTGFTDAYITPGSGTRDNLASQLESGLVITNLEGLHAGLDPVTGDFSLSAKGFRVEKGALGDPVRNFTVAGNFFDLIKQIEGKANDRSLYRTGAFSSPSLLVTGISVSA